MEERVAGVEVFGTQVGVEPAELVADEQALVDDDRVGQRRDDQAVEPA